MIVQSSMEGFSKVFEIVRLWFEPWNAGDCERWKELSGERIPELLETPAAVRFVSAEPLLGPIKFDRRWLDNTSLHCEQGHTFPHVAVDQLSYRQGPSETFVTPICRKCGSDAKAGFAPRIDWIIVGGESGPGARPMHPDWVRDIRDQCTVAGVPFFFKQWGQFKHGSTFGKEPGRDVIVFNDGVMLCDTRREACLAEDRARGWAGRSPEMMARVGKKRAGRELDGREHNDFPKVNEVAA